MPPQPFASLQMPCGLATLLRSKRMVAGMSVSRNRLNGTGIRLSAAIAADYFALLKPRVMALAVFTAFVGLVMAPGVINPLVVDRCHSGDRCRGGRRRRAQHVVRRGH